MQGMFSCVVLAVLAVSSNGAGVSLNLHANPIRKVVTALQKMEAKVKDEGEKETELHEKAMCECKTGKAEYTTSISDGEAKVESLAAELESGIGALAQLKSDLANHKADREAAKQALADAKAMREKEAKAYGGVKAEAEANMEACNKAVAAIEKNAAASFIQSDAAQVLRNLANSNSDMISDSRSELLAFLSNEDESMGGGEIVGVLKQLGDEMAKDLATATEAEEKAIANYEGLVADKNAEVAELTKAIEDKITRVGETGVAIEDMKADASDTADKLAEDKKFLVDLTAECANKEKEWDAICKERAAELLALADTIKMLNDDDALELFKKTLPSAASSFMQLQQSSQAVKARALATLHEAMKSSKPSTAIDLIAVALHGNTAGFTKVIKMVDEMVAVLGSEQKDDDDKKAYCEKEIDAGEDKLKVFQQLARDADTAIKDAKESIATLESEIAQLVGGIALLDKAVTEATAQRKEENAAFKTVKAGNAAAGELIKMAKARLSKFYGFVQVPAPSFLQVRRMKVETTTNVQKANANGVMGMMDALTADLEKETAVAEANENDAQADYEKLMADSKQKRADDSALIEDKVAAKADAEGILEQRNDGLQVAFEKIKGATDQLQALHKDCDWLLSNYDSRKEARVDEVDSLKKAKAVLSGADLIQEN
jgi:hypothetical protein